MAEKLILFGTRIHRRNTNTELTKIDLEPLKKLSSTITANGDYYLAIAVDGQDHELIQKVEESFKENPKIEVIKCPFWEISPPLNHILTYASRSNFKFVAYQSIEVQVQKNEIDKILNLFKEDTLVVGLSLENHSFEEGEKELNGGNCPWNTFAIWRVSYLSLVGFLPVSDGLIKGIEAGVEEVVTISLLQALKPNESKAILFETKSSKESWNTKWDDPERIAWHKKKIESKISRPETQLKALNLKPGKVLHIREN